MRLLKTDIRTLEKAKRYGQVRVAEYFGGKDPNSGIKDAEKRKFVDRNISIGLLRGGDFFNQYVLTENGMRALLENEEKSRLKAERKEKREKKNSSP